MMNNQPLQTQEDICKYYHLHDKKLGEGGFAQVRLATDLETKQYVAVKCLDKVKLGPELPRIYNEIECLKKLKHRNIARLYRVFETPSVIYLVLEYCAGGELFDYIVKKSKLDEPEAAQMIYDLMRVLNYIHLNGISHRDLKPENVLLDEKHQIKLIDFGLAANCSADNMAINKNQAPMDQLSTCCGSVTYAAPEVIAGRNYKGTAVDVWSAGVMMYALLVGQLPFNDNSISKLYQKIQGGIKNLPAFLSPDACDLLRRMLTVDPEHRITVRQVLQHPWLRARAINFSRINRRLEFNPSRGIKRSPQRQAPVMGPIVINPANQTSPTKRPRYVTVSTTPKTPRTPPSYLRRLRETRETRNGSPYVGSITPLRHINRTTGKIQQACYSSNINNNNHDSNQENNNNNIYQLRSKQVLFGATTPKTPKKSIVKRLLKSATTPKRKICKWIRLNE